MLCDILRMICPVITLQRVIGLQWLSYCTNVAVWCCQVGIRYSFIWWVL